MGSVKRNMSARRLAIATGTFLAIAYAFVLIWLFL